MDEEVFNISIRKFLKKVGITSQIEIEKSLPMHYRMERLIRMRFVKFRHSLKLICQINHYLLMGKYVYLDAL